MEPRIDSNLAATFQQSGMESALPQQTTTSGEFRGQAVTVTTDAASDVADAAEEMTFAAGEKLDKSLTDRKAEGRNLMSTHAVELAEMYMERMADANQREKLLEFAGELRKNPPTSQQDLQQQVKERFPDSSDQFTALAFAEELFQSEGGKPELVALIHDAKETLMAEKGGEIRAGLNIVSELRSASESGLGEASQLRELYRDSVLGNESISDTFQKVMKQGGPEQFHKTVDFLIRATGNDMQSQTPSTESAQLKTTVDDLYQVQMLGNIHRSMDGLLGSVEKNFGLKPTGDATKLMGDVLALTQNRYVRADQVTATVDNLGIGKDTEANIYFQTQLKEQVRLIPLKLYPNPENREKLIEATQQSLDNAIAKEEAGL